MKAVFIDAPGKLKIADVATPVPGEGEVLVHLRCCGVCGTDLEKIHGLGITSKIIGHEEVGEVSQLGPGVTGLAVGDRVFAHHHVPCGECGICRRGEQTLCPEYSKHNLVPCGLAEEFIVPKYNVDRGTVLKLPDSIGFEEASFIEPVACCIRGLEKAKARTASSVVIYGAGPVGLLHLKLLKSFGRNLVVMADISDYRLGLAGRMGADATFNVTNESQRKEALGSFPSDPELAILATGSSAALEEAMGVVAKGGTVLLFGAPKSGATATIDTAKLFLRSTNLISSYAATEVETAQALKLLNDRSIIVSDMITHRFPLSRAADAFDVADKQQCMKALITA